MQIGMLRLAGLQNDQCAGKVEAALAATAGVDAASVSYENAKASVRFDESQVSLQDLHAVVQQAGYRIAVHGEDGACCGGCGG
ncbi:heavy-metal-associated domain-containing protein [Alcaligenes sp. SDU_A2]|uniref:heavy-metal-associated domain-containing protein n=1 Tax=Alcaligenes sp. SDU_A2 TaxID=3136634 RepID=UPI002B8C7844|nr:heavy metal-associated domain-containing protein [Alcaligenes faecalis]